MTYLVTGGGGFIGSHLVRHLVQQGEQVRVLDNSSSGSRAKLGEMILDVEWIDGDIRDVTAIDRACRNVDVVLHHAAIVSTQTSILRPEFSHDVNLTATLHLLQAAQHAGVRRFVFASSAAVYGDTGTPVQREDMATAPLSPYGVQKLAAEAYCRMWPGIFDMEAVALRYFNIFGPRQDPSSVYSGVISRFITAVLANQSPTIYGDGEQSRDFVPVQNVVMANMLAATHPDAAGKVFNVGLGQAITLNQLIATLGTIVGCPVTADYQPARSGDIRESRADITRIQQVLGFAPIVSFADGLRQTLAAYAEEMTA